MSSNTFKSMMNEIKSGSAGSASIGSATRASSSLPAGLDISPSGEVDLSQMDAEAKALWSKLEDLSSRDPEAYNAFLRRQIEIAEAEASGRQVVYPLPGRVLKGAIASRCDPLRQPADSSVSTEASSSLSSSSRTAATPSPSDHSDAGILPVPVVPKDVAEGHVLWINFCHHPSLSAPTTTDDAGGGSTSKGARKVRSVLDIEKDLAAAAAAAEKAAKASAKKGGGGGGGSSGSTKQSPPPKLPLQTLLNLNISTAVGSCRPVKGTSRTEWALDVLTHRWTINQVESRADFRDPHFLTFLIDCIREETGLCLVLEALEWRGDDEKRKYMAARPRRSTGGVPGNVLSIPGHPREEEEPFPFDLGPLPGRAKHLVAPPPSATEDPLRGEDVLSSPSALLKGLATGGDDEGGGLLSGAVASGDTGLLFARAKSNSSSSSKPKTTTSSTTAASSSSATAKSGAKLIKTLGAVAVADGGASDSSTKKSSSSSGVGESKMNPPTKLHSSSPDSANESHAPTVSSASPKSSMHLPPPPSPSKQIIEGGLTASDVASSALSETASTSTSASTFTQPAIPASSLKEKLPHFLTAVKQTRETASSSSSSATTTSENVLVITFDLNTAYLDPLKLKMADIEVEVSSDSCRVSLDVRNCLLTPLPQHNTGSPHSSTPETFIESYIAPLDGKVDTVNVAAALKKQRTKLVIKCKLAT